MSSPSAIVRATRQTTAGPAFETVHRVHVAVTSTSGALIGSAGNPDYTTPLRSCLKPFQAVALFESDAISRFGISSSELALACASHEGALAHTTLVEAWLSRLGLTHKDLQCGVHPPGDQEALATLQREGRSPTALHNNCSGKHTGMLAAALALNADPRTYLHARHPVQLLIRDFLHRQLASSLDWGVDGCSAPTPILPLRGLATLYARLIAAAIPGSGLDDHHLATTAQAMLEHPELIGGRGVLDTRLMRSIGARVLAAGPHALIAKRGADGVYAMAYHHPELGPLGVALKVEDGSGEARAPAVLAVLDQLGAVSPASRVALADLIRPERKNHRGLLIGHMEVDLDLGLQRPPS